jgi:hypothetical protein
MKLKKTLEIQNTGGGEREENARPGGLATEG